jgi:hypothetical protein
VSTGRERLWVLSRRGRAILRIIGYGSILAALAMLGMHLEPDGPLATLMAAAPVLLGPTTLVLLLLQPAVSRWEGWFACLCSLTLLIVLMLPALRAD